MTSSSQPNSFPLQLFREELERVVGDSMRESGTEGISALLSDVMNIKNGSESFLQTTLTRSLIEVVMGFMEKQEKDIFTLSCFFVQCLLLAKGSGKSRSGPSLIFQSKHFRKSMPDFFSK